MGVWGGDSKTVRFCAGAMLAGLAFAGLASLAESAETSSAPKNEIVIGTHLDLSGPLASWGSAVKNGLTLAVEEANAAGGIQGKTLRLIARDDSYDPTKAAAAVRQFAETDKVFAILSPLGTPTSRAGMSEAAERNLLYLFPMTPSEEAYEPRSPLTFSLTPTHAMEAEEGLRRLLNARGAMKVGILASDDEFGHDVRKGARSELQQRGLPITAEAMFGKDETEFESALDALRDKGVDLVVLGTEAGQALQVTRAAAAMRWKPVFLCSSACYESEFATLAGADGDGLYAVGQVSMPYPEDAKLAPFVKRYEARFSSVANVHALAAYRSARLFFAVMRQAGPNPTSAQFARTLETRGSWTDPTLGGLPVEFSESDHLGTRTSLLTQIRRGRWAVLNDPAAPALRRER